METGNPTILRNRRSNSAEGIKKDDGFGRRLILVLLLIASVVCVSFLILNPATPSVPSVQEQDPQTVLLEEIANNEGMFDEQSIVLYNISPAIADEFAEKVNGSLRMSFDRKFATITLPSSVSIKDVASDSEFSDYFSSISLDYHVSASEIESDLRLPMSPSVSASDPFYGSQSYLDYLNLKDTWNHTKGAGITVAVIDTGIDTDHPEFIGRISEYSYNASLDKVVKDYDDWSLIEDEQGHGTAVSGVIAAAWNDIGVAGISPDVELLVIKAECYDNGSFVRTSDLVFGLYYAIERDVDVVNMSFGGAADDNPYAAATKLAVDSDIICVAAAGNESTSDLTYPAADPNVIGVGALSASDWGLAEYSNYGENSDIVAPGTTFTTEMGGGYDIANGTSLASPVVTAVLALYLSQNPYQEFSDVMEILYASCYDLGSPGDDWYFGFGALDAYALLFEERGIVTFDMLTDEIDDIEKIFIRGHALQDIPEPERLYSVFDGWYYDINCTEEYNWYLDVFTSDLTLYASWVNEDDTVPYTYVELGDGTIEILSYTGHRKYLTIPDIIDGKEVSSISDSAFKNETNVRSINLPERLKTIKVSAFEGCTSLVSINIPNTVESIGEAAFKNCQRLEGVELTSESSLNVIGMFAFQNCSSLSRFDIPEKVMSLEGSVFYGCTRMSSFILDSDNRNFTVKDGVLFNKVATKIIAYPAGKGTSYNIPGIVCDIGDYSFGYSKLRFIDLKSISYVGECAFAYSKLESLIIGDGVTACGKGAFSNCFDLSSVEIGNGLRDISEELFSGTFSLKSIIIPPQVISISAAAFSNSGLTSITFDEYSSLVSIGFASFVDSSLISISIPDSLLLIGDYAFSGTLSLNSIVFSDDSNLQKIGLKAFENTPSLESVELPSNLWMIGEYAFLDSGLKGSISIPASVAEIGGGAFASCVGITSFSVEDDNKSYVAKDGVLYSASGDVLVEYPAGRVGSTYSVLDSVETIYHSAFYGSINLDSIVLPESLIDIQQHSFYLVSNLLSISIPANVISIGMYAFAMDWSLSIIEFTGESKITRFGLGTFSYSGIVSLIIPASVTSIAQGAFTSCSQLHNIIFAENSCLEYVSAYMFDGCDNLTNVTFQNGSKLTSIQAHGFHNASALMSINFGDAKLLNVGNYSFMSCESLLSITLPDTLEEIGRFAFYGCSSLSEVKIPSNVKFIGRVAFDTGSGIRIYFDSDVPPTHLQEGWDDGVRGYHFGIKDILECEDWTYAILESGNVSIIEYRGDEKQLDLSSFVFGDVVTIGNGAFKRSPITSIVLPNTLTTIQAEAFEDSMLESITIPLGVKFIGREAFQNSALNSISFEGSSSVQVIEKYAFAYLDYLNSFDLPSSVDTLGVGVFQQSNIKSFAFESGSSLTEIPEMAFYGTSIESIILPDSVSHIGHSAFRDITSLRFIDLGDSERLTIESNVFYHCGLTSLFIGKNVDYIGEYAFVGLNSLQHFTVDSENPKYKSVDGILFTKDGKKLISCPSGKLGSYVIPVNVETIGFGAFEDTTLSSIDFAPGINITSIGYRAFFNADNLETIFIPSSVVSIDYYAFAYCDNLVEVLFGEDSLLTGVYEGVFYGCSSLSSIVLPESVREISDFAFYGCSSLISIPVSDDSEILEFGSYSFAHSGLVELNVPSNVVCIGDYAFRATDITEATIDVESIIDLRLGFGIFADNTSIETLTIPFLGAFFDEGGAWLGYTFGASMYSYNGDYVPSSLKYLHIIGDITYLYDGAFYNCSNLEEIVFPDTLVSMSNCDVFFSCSAKSNLVWDLNYYEGYLDEVHCSLDPLYGLIMPNEADQYNIAGDILNFRISSKNLTEIYFGDSCPDLTGMVISAPNLNKIYISENNRSISESSGIIYNYEKTEAVIVLTLSKKVMIPGTLRIVPERFINQNVGVVDLVIEEGVEVIESQAFHLAYDLETVTLPSTLRLIESGAFNSNIRVVYNNSPLDIVPRGIGNGNVALNTDYVVNPSGTLSSVFSDPVFKEITTSDGFRFYETNDGYVLTSYLGNQETMILPSNILGEDYSIYGFEGLKNIILPEGMESISNSAFSAGFETIVLPSTLKTIEDHAFSGGIHSELICNEGLESIGDSIGTFSRIYISSTVKTIKSCLSVLDSVEVSIDNDSFIFLDEILYSSDYKSLVYVPADISGDVVLPDGLEILPRGAFYGSNITSIDLPDSLKFIEPGCFSQCSYLRELIIPDGANCNIYFMDGSGVERVVIGDAVDTFSPSACNNLTEVIVSENNPYFREVDGVFYSADYKVVKFVSPTISGSVKLLDGVKELDNNAFSLARERYDLVLPDTVERLGSGCFYDSGLGSIVLSKSIREVTSSVFNQAFYLTKIVLPSGIEKISGGAFHNCPNLYEVTLPDTLVTIEDYAFEMCPSIYRIVNNSSLSLEFGSVTHGGIAQHASQIIESDGSLRIYDGSSEVINLDGFIFIKSGVEFGLVVYEGELSCPTLPETIRNQPYCVGPMTRLECAMLPKDSSQIRLAMIEKLMVPSDVGKLMIYSGIEEIHFNGTIDEWISLDFTNHYSKYDLYIDGGLVDSVSLSQPLVKNFKGCKSIRNVVLEEGVVALGDYAFADCININTISIPESLNNMGAHAFDNSSLYNDVSNWKDGMFILDDWMISVDASMAYAVIPDGVSHQAKTVYYGCESLIYAEVLQSDVSLFTCTALEIIRARSFNHNLITSNNLALDVVILTLDATIEERMFDGLTGISIYVDYSKKDVESFNELYPNWNNGNEVFSYDEWHMATFYDYNEVIISMQPYLVGKVVHQPCIEDLYSQREIFKFLGWDITGDGCVDFTPATLVTDLKAYAVGCIIDRQYVVEYYDDPSKGPIFSEVYEYEDLLSLPNDPVKRGYEFQYWYGYVPGMHIFSDYKFYAIWSHEGGDHEYSTVLVSPDCVSGGYELHTCNICGHSYKSDEIAQTGHKFGEWSVITVPSCIDSGMMARTCELCGEIEEDICDMTDHNYVSSVVKAPSCTKGGTIIYKCSVCGEVLSGDIPIQRHHYIKFFIDESTKNYLVENLAGTVYHSDSTFIYSCSDCGHVMAINDATSTKSASILDSSCTHVVGESHCIEVGDTVIYAVSCGLCDGILECNVLMHTFENYIYNNDATCEHDGTETSYCTEGDGCELTRTKVGTALGHDWGAGVITVKPTIYEDGNVHFECSRCDSVRDDSIPKLISVKVTFSVSGIGSVDCMDCTVPRGSTIDVDDNVITFVCEDFSYIVTATAGVGDDSCIHEFLRWSNVVDGGFITVDTTIGVIFKTILSDYDLPEGSADIITTDQISNNTELSSEFVDRLKSDVQSGNVDSFTFVMDEGSVKLDGSSISVLAGGETITVDKVEINDVPDVIDTKVGDRPVFEVSVGDIHDFGDGRLTISLAYALSVGESADNLQVWHFNDDGSYTIEQCQYDGSKVTFSTGRLSYFSIMHVEPPADDPDDGDDGGSNMMIFVGVGAGALVIVGIAVFFLLRRKA